MSVVITWTNELIDTLIDLYHTQSVLWNPKDVNYKNKNKKKDAWKTISDVMGLHELEIQRKIKNLTAQFFRKKKKLKEENKSGSATSDTTKWFAYQRLLFLSDKNEPKLCLEKGLNEKHDSGSEEVEAEISQNQNMLPNEGNTSNTIVPPSSDSEPPNSQPGPSTAPCIGKKTKCSKRKVSTGDQRQEEAYNVLKELQAKKNRHKYSAFGEHVAMKMEALKSSYAQNVVEHEISNILFQASIGKYDYPATGHSGQMTPISTHSSSSSFPIHPPLSSPDDT
ncbi:uncharacterized protein LOC126885343 [Diabrotica virgifera virgifera]|uniref:MADF domain-containing protein n=1 Tax=Diabrotica virgifera virgifera TaxID=50390 RepID=A0ABM5KCD7_DIAVI|nr:uncharacterized protein LOC126885343 [Diabrotica virgifera virgifera]